MNGIGLDQETLPEQLTKDPAVARAVRELERASLSPQEREVYEGEKKKKMVDAVQIRDAEQKGKQEGKQEGLQEGMLRLLTRQMTRRLGEVPSSVAAKMRSLNAGMLDALDLALPDLHTYADVEQWLARD